MVVDDKALSRNRSLHHLKFRSIPGVSADVRFAQSFLGAAVPRKKPGVKQKNGPSSGIRRTKRLQMGMGRGLGPTKVT